MQFKKETYSIKAAEYIRGLIRSGVLQPGQPVREAQISEKLNISRAPIREALLMLAHQGLICSEPQKGKYVRSMSAKEIYDSYVVAGILEGAAVAHSLPSWTNKERDAFAEVVRRLDDQVNYAAHLDTLAEIDEAFHMTLLSALHQRKAHRHCPHVLFFAGEVPLLYLLAYFVHAQGVLRQAHDHCRHRGPQATEEASKWCCAGITRKWGNDFPFWCTKGTRFTDPEKARTGAILCRSWCGPWRRMRARGGNA